MLLPRRVAYPSCVQRQSQFSRRQTNELVCFPMPLWGSLSLIASGWRYAIASARMASHHAPRALAAPYQPGAFITLAGYLTMRRTDPARRFALPHPTLSSCLLSNTQVWSNKLCVASSALSCLLKASMPELGQISTCRRQLPPLAFLVAVILGQVWRRGSSRKWAMAGNEMRRAWAKASSGALCIHPTLFFEGS